MLKLPKNYLRDPVLIAVAPAVSAHHAIAALEHAIRNVPKNGLLIRNVSDGNVAWEQTTGGSGLDCRRNWVATSREAFRRTCWRGLLSIPQKSCT
jgi:hypothetical protein